MYYINGLFFPFPPPPSHKNRYYIERFRVRLTLVTVQIRRTRIRTIMEKKKKITIRLLSPKRVTNPRGRAKGNALRERARTRKWMTRPFAVVVVVEANARSEVPREWVSGTRDCVYYYTYIIILWPIRRQTANTDGNSDRSPMTRTVWSTFYGEPRAVGRNSSARELEWAARETPENARVGKEIRWDTVFVSRTFFGIPRRSKRTARRKICLLDTRVSLKICRAL